MVSSSLQVNLIRDELIERIGKFQRLVDLLDDIYSKSSPGEITSTDLAQPITATRADMDVKHIRKSKKPAIHKPGKHAPKNPTGGKTVRSADGQSKICHGCLEMKPLTDYTPHKECKDGFQGTCRECKRQAYHAKRAKRVAKSPVASPESKSGPKATMDRPYHCAECGKSFHTQIVFREHLCAAAKKEA